MSIVVYQCDTCNRDIDIVRNEHGLDTINRCVITHGCKGTLHQIQERPTGVRGTPTEDVDGLDNFRQRNILHVHDQTLSSSSWTVNHNLNTDPSSHVYIHTIALDGNRSTKLVDPETYVVTYIDADTSVIEFASATTGVVHSVARSSNPADDQVKLADPIFVQVSANAILTIATAEFSGQSVIQMMSFISPSTGSVVVTPVEFTAHKDDTTSEIALFNTPWQDTDTVLANGQPYKVRSVRISDIIQSQNIEPGSPFFFNNPSDFILLLSTAPYESSVDHNLNSTVLPEDIISSGTVFNSHVLNDELHVDGITTTEYHPAIKIITTIFG